MKRKLCYILVLFLLMGSLFMLQSNPPIPEKLQNINRKMIIDDVRDHENGFIPDVKDPYCFYYSIPKRHLFLKYRWSSYWVFSEGGRLRSVQFRSYNKIAGFFDRSGCIQVNDIEGWYQTSHNNSTNTAPIATVQP